MVSVLRGDFSEEQREKSQEDARHGLSFSQELREQSQEDARHGLGFSQELRDIYKNRGATSSLFALISSL